MADLPADADSRSARTSEVRVDWPLLAALAVGLMGCAAFWGWVAVAVLRL